MQLHPKRIFISLAVVAAFGGVSAHSYTITTLLGTGIPGVLASGCTPSAASDFIDNADDTVTRLQPRDCGIVKTSTPMFSWTSPPDRNKAYPYTFTLTRGGVTIATRTSTKPWINITSPVLSSGMYSWTVSYATTQGVQRISKTRQFAIPSGSAVYPIPSGSAFVSRVAYRAHPRVLPSGSSFSAIATKASTGEYSAAYSALIAGANAARVQTPPTPDVVIGNPMHQTSNERFAIEQLALAGLFTGDASYTTAGINHLLRLAQWSPTGPTSQTSNDQANREIYLALAEGLDLFYAHLSGTQINSIVVPLKARLNEIFSTIGSLDSWPNDSHMLTDIKYITQALMHVVGAPGFNEASTWLATSWEMYVNMFNAFSTDDGGFGNGVAYGWYNMDAAAPSLAAIQVMGGVGLMSLPAVKNIGNFLIAMTPPNQRQMSPLGDETETDEQFVNNTWDAFRLYSAVTRIPTYEWYWRTRPQNLTIKAYPGIWQFMHLGLNETLPVPSAPSAGSWAFEDAGIVAIHSKTSDSLRSSVFFHSSRYGSFNHSHASQNSFELMSHGENVLISSGYYPTYGSPHHMTDTRATRYKNALTFDGGIGQAEPTPTPTAPGQPYMSMEASGKLLNYYDNNVWAVSTGDATLAYRGRNSTTGAWTPLLSNVIRTVAYNRVEKVLVVYDWATSAKARKWELNFHSLTPFTVNVNMAKTITASQKASACVDVYGPPGSFVATSGFDVAPEGTYPTQYHARYTVSGAAPQLVGITVIREDCRGVGKTVQFSGTKATVTINGGSPIVFDQKTVAVPN